MVSLSRCRVMVRDRNSEFRRPGRHVTGTVQVGWPRPGTWPGPGPGPAPPAAGGPGHGARDRFGLVDSPTVTPDSHWQPEARAAPTRDSDSDSAWQPEPESRVCQ
jgi:hypothetical protein